MPASTFIPYIRGTVLDFTVKGLKSFTQVYPFFDNQDVSDYCKMSSTAVYGGALITDVNGELTGQFRIPGGTFLAGTKLFSLTNDSTGDITDADSVAVVTFSTNEFGTYESSNIISTQVPNITPTRSITIQEPVSSRQTFGISYKDPIAQTFIIQGNPYGVALTKMEVYFKTRPSVNAPITLHIRETIDGFPGDSILPYSSVTLYPKDVNVSADASAPTVFLFSSPVYLKNNTEYAFVLQPAGDNYDYEVWVGELGGLNVGTSEIIDSQPNIGRMFIPNNNSSWSVFETKDIKFTAYTADFNDSVTGTLELKNKKVDYIDVPSSVTLYPGDYIIQSTGIGEVLYFDNVSKKAEVLILTGYLGTSASADTSRATPVTGTCTATTSSTTVNGNSNNNFVEELIAGDVLITSTNTSIGTIATVSSGSLTLIANSSVAFTATSIYVREGSQFEITKTNNKTHAISPTLSYLNFKTTDVDWSYKMYSSAGVAGSYAEMPEIAFVTQGEKQLYSYSNESTAPLSLSSTTGTLMVKAVVNADTDNISPIIDIEKSKLILLENYVDALTDLITGRVTTTTSSSTVIGTGTAFLTEIFPGAVLRIKETSTTASPKILGVVKAVISDTSLLLEASSEYAVTNEEITADNIASDEYTARVGQYITKPIQLSNNQDADDLYVFLRATIPSLTDVRVYAKLLSSTDTAGMTGRKWTQLVKTVPEASLTNIGNLQYKLPIAPDNAGATAKVYSASGGLSAAGEFTYKSLDNTATFNTFRTFAIKIVMLTSNPAVVPAVDTMSVVALQA